MISLSMETPEITREVSLYQKPLGAKRRYLLTLGHIGITLPIGETAVIAGSVIIEVDVVDTKPGSFRREPWDLAGTNEVLIVGLPDGRKFTKPLKAWLQTGHVAAAVEIGE